MGIKCARSRHSVVHLGECRDDLLLLLFLYGHHLQPHGCGRQYEEVWWLYSRPAPWKADGRLYRSHADAPHLRGGDLSVVRGDSAGLYDSLPERAVLFWRNRPAHRRRCGYGYHAADRIAPSHATLRKLPQKGSLARTSIGAIDVERRVEEECRCGSFFWGPRLREKGHRPGGLRRNVAYHIFQPGIC